LTGEIASLTDIPEGDFRRLVPKFQGSNFENNLKLIQEIVSLAKRKGVAPAQIALAWVRSLSNKPGLPTLIPIPGGTTKDKVTQNTKGVEILTDEEMTEIDSILKGHEVQGTRY
jgi:pyridoxine 4-dehydrogenase